MKQTKFKVLKCTQKEDKTGYVWTLSCIEETTCFGIKKTVSRKCYIGGMPKEVAIGTELTEDISRFDLVRRPYSFKDELGKVVDIDLLWLHIKIGA